MTMPNTAFNMSILKVDESTLARVPRIRTAEVFDGVQTQFHPEGLFSTVLFGAQGTTQRDYTFGHIKLNTTVMHPHICRILKELKADYEEIWKGKLFAIFDPAIKDFVRADIETGETGFAFFMKHIHELKPRQTESIRRDRKLKVFEKYRDLATIKHFLVMPAGLRDIEIGKDGRAVMDDINTFYQSIINYSNTLENAPRIQGDELNNIRLGIQLKINEVFNYIENMMTGKKGFLQAKWGARNIFDSGANVISAQNPLGYRLGDPSTPDIDTTIYGLFQVCITTIPLQVYLVRQSKAYQTTFPNSYGNEIVGIDPITLKRVVTTVPDSEIDLWTGIEGIGKQIKWMESIEDRHRPVKVGRFYLALIYQDNEKFQVLMDIDELPHGWDKKKVRPMTKYEFFYLIGLAKYDDIPTQCTRYPVAGDGSVYLAKIMVKTTTESLRLKEYEDGEATGRIAYDYPIYGHKSFIATISPSSTMLQALGGDLIRSVQGHLKPF